MTEPRILWQPDPATVARSRMTAFREWVAASRGVQAPDYAALWRWSVTDLEGFWGAFAQFAGIRFHAPPQRVLADATMPGARWFPGATLNYAEHALATGPGKGDADLAVIYRREDGIREEVSFGQLRQRVAAARAGLVSLGPAAPPAAAQTSDSVTVNATAGLGTIPAGAIGLNTAVYDGYMNDTPIPGLLKAAGIDALRCPGGAYSDIYNLQTGTLIGSWPIDISGASFQFLGDGNNLVASIGTVERGQDRLVDTTTPFRPGSSLLADSRPYGAGGIFGTFTQDGNIGMDFVNHRGRVLLVEYSAASGKVLRNIPIGPSSATDGPYCCGVLWASANGHEVWTQCGTRQLVIVGGHATQIASLEARIDVDDRANVIVRDDGVARCALNCG